MSPPNDARLFPRSLISLSLGGTHVSLLFQPDMEPGFAEGGNTGEMTGGESASACVSEAKGRTL